MSDIPELTGENSGTTVIVGLVYTYLRMASGGVGCCVNSIRILRSAPT